MKNKQKEYNMISIRLGQTKVTKKLLKDKMGTDRTLKQCMSSLMDTVGEWQANQLKHIMRDTHPHALFSSNFSC